MLDFVFRVVIVVDILSYQIFNPFQTACFEPSLEMKALQNPKSCHWEIFENWCLIWVQFPRKVLLQEFYITKTSSSEVIFKSFSIRFEETKCENASRMITIDNLSFKLHYVLSWMLQLHLWYKRIVPAVVSGNPICEIFSFLFALNELYGKDFPLPSTPCRVTRILSTHKWGICGRAFASLLTLNHIFFEIPTRFIHAKNFFSSWDLRRRKSKLLEKLGYRNVKTWRKCRVFLSSAKLISVI